MLDFIENGTMVQVDSQWQGEIGDRINFTGFIYSSWTLSKYGALLMYCFVDEDGNLYHWRTTKPIPFTKGIKISVTGTVKDHTTDEYYERVTLIRYCKVEKA